MKRCTKCLKNKDIAEFYKDKSRKDGHRFICKDCFNIASNRHIETRIKYLEKNKEKIKNRHKEYNIKHKEQISKQRKAYGAKNKEIIRERSRVFYVRFPEYSTANQFFRMHGLKMKDIPDDIFSLKVMQVKLYRTAKLLRRLKSEANVN